MKADKTAICVSLDKLRRGQSGVIVAVEAAKGALASLPLEVLRRLIELGFVAGERVRVVAEGFPRRDPIAVSIGHASFALRRLEASAIWVKPDLA